MPVGSFACLNSTSFIILCIGMCLAEVFSIHVLSLHLEYNEITEFHFNPVQKTEEASSTVYIYMILPQFVMTNSLKNLRFCVNNSSQHILHVRCDESLLLLFFG